MADRFRITEDIYAEVSEFRGKKRVDIRRWYFDKEANELKRTRKGINLSIEEWDDFSSNFVDLSNFVEKKLEK